MVHPAIDVLGTWSKLWQLDELDGAGVVDKHSAMYLGRRHWHFDSVVVRFIDQFHEWDDAA